jgi:hypothetical protein
LAKKEEGSLVEAGWRTLYLFASAPKIMEDLTDDYQTNLQVG